MRSIVIFLSLLVFSVSNIRAQYFEGIIDYHVRVYEDSSWDGNIIEQQRLFSSFLKQQGTHQRFTLSENAYWFTTDGELEYVSYQKDQNTLLIKFLDQDVVQKTDSRVNDEKVDMIEFLNETDTILGIICNSLIIYSKNSWLKIWYADKFYIDPSFFKKHKYYFMDVITRETKSVPLKLLEYRDGVFNERTAFQIVERDIDLTGNSDLSSQQIDSINLFRDCVIKNLFKISIPQVLNMNQQLSDEISVIFENLDYGLTVSLLDLDKSEVEWTSLEGFREFMKNNLYHWIDNCELLSEEKLISSHYANAYLLNLKGDIDGSTELYYKVGIYENETHYLGVITEAVDFDYLKVRNAMMNILRSVSSL